MIAIPFGTERNDCKDIIKKMIEIVSQFEDVNDYAILMKLIDDDYKFDNVGDIIKFVEKFKIPKEFIYNKQIKEIDKSNLYTKTSPLEKKKYYKNWIIPNGNR